MITYEEALKKAREAKDNIETCEEYKDGYIFYGGGRGFGGKFEPVAVTKKDGQVLNILAFYDSGEYDTSTVLRRFKVANKN